MEADSTHVGPQPVENMSPSTFRPAPEFRWCFYLHLNTATESNETWRERDGTSQPIFSVRAKRRVVFVRGYFDDHHLYGGGWCQIYQVTTKDKLPNGKKKSNIKPVGQVFTDDDRLSYVQTIPERYPTTLLEKLEKMPKRRVDQMTVAMTCKILDSITYRGESRSPE